MIGFVLMAAAAVSAVNLQDDIQSLIPTVNLTAIRYIGCEGHDDKGKKVTWTGSGYLIANRELATDNHVANYTKDAKCQDIVGGLKLHSYKTDNDHDFAIMTGDYPSDFPPIKYTCQPFKKDHLYTSYGITDWSSPYSLFRQQTIRMTGYDDITFDDGQRISHLAQMKGFVVPGMSGGPVIDEYGYAHGQNEGGESDILGLPDGNSSITELSQTALCTGKWDQ